MTLDEQLTARHDDIKGFLVELVTLLEGLDDTDLRTVAQFMHRVAKSPQVSEHPGVQPVGRVVSSLAFTLTQHRIDHAEFTANLMRLRAGDGENV